MGDGEIIDIIEIIGTEDKLDLQKAHLRELSNLSLILKEEPIIPDNRLLEKAKILHWVEEEKAKGRIDEAKRYRGSASPSFEPNWNGAVLSCIESAAMYLRRDEDMYLAIEAVKQDDFDSALKYLNAAQRDIEEVATALGMEFVQLCDLAEQPPLGKPHWSGAFCGAFVSDEPGAKSIGIAFKGTNNSRESAVDLAIGLITPPGSVLHGRRIHNGFYTGLFGDYITSGTVSTPFDMIKAALAQFKGKGYLSHITGHSLGGAYATLLHCEFVRLSPGRGGDEPPPVPVKDVVTFGSPRVGVNNFAKWFVQYNKMSNSRSWRITNRLDPVTVLPPRVSGTWYTHVDTEYLFGLWGRPMKKETEINHFVEAQDEEVEEEEGLLPGWNPHTIDSYYSKIQNAF